MAQDSLKERTLLYSDFGEKVFKKGRKNGYNATLSEAG